jgi:hypothetical protein
MCATPPTRHHLDAPSASGGGVVPHPTNALALPCSELIAAPTRACCAATVAVFWPLLDIASAPHPCMMCRRTQTFAARTSPPWPLRTRMPFQQRRSRATSRLAVRTCGLCQCDVCQCTLEACTRAVPLPAACMSGSSERGTAPTAPGVSIAKACGPTCASRWGSMPCKPCMRVRQCRCSVSSPQRCMQRPSSSPARPRGPRCSRSWGPACCSEAIPSTWLLLALSRLIPSRACRRAPPLPSSRTWTGTSRALASCACFALLPSLRGQTRHLPCPCLAPARAL